MPPLDVPNRRRFFRCPVSTDCRAAELIFKSRRVPVHLLDESAEGFSVGSEQDLGLAIGEGIVLRTSSGHYQVEVVHLAYVQRPAGIEGHGMIWRIGVRRVRFLCAENEKPQLNAQVEPEWRPQRKRRRLFPVVIAACIATLVLGGLFVLRRCQDTWQLERAAAGEFVNPLRVERPELSRPRAETVYWPLGPETLELRKTVERLPGAVALTLPKITSRLDLTVSQQEKIQRVIEMTNQAVRQYEIAYASAPPEELNQRRLRVFHAARRDALQILTPGQREMFEDLLTAGDN